MAAKQAEHQRKAIEAEVRNQFYRQSQPLRKRISEIESELTRHEARFRELEHQFSDVESYKDSARVIGMTSEYQRLKDAINTLTEQWESLSAELEGLVKAHELEMGGEKRL